MPTIRILHIARYRNKMLERKVDYMSQDAGFVFLRVRPNFYEDAYGSLTSQLEKNHKNDTLFLSLIGKHIDPHRVLYGSLTFSMVSFMPDIIHAEDEPDSLATLHVLFVRRLFAPKAKLILHTWQNINRKKRALVQWLTNSALHASTAILSSNVEGVNVLREMGFKGLIEIVPPEGIDTELFKPPVTRKQNVKFTIFYAGRFAEEKGLDTFLEAMSHITREASLILVGEGPLKHTLIERGSRLQINEHVQFLSPVTQDRMPNLYAQADVPVLPSRETSVWKEQYGRFLLEAMARRVPVIGSDSGAIPEVVGDCGLLFQENNAGELTNCLRRLIDSPEFCMELGEKGYKRANVLFSQSEIAHKTAQFYLKVAAL